MTIWMLIGALIVGQTTSIGDLWRAPVPPTECHASVTHLFAGARVTPGRTTAVLSIVNPQALPQQISVTLLKANNQKPQAISALVRPHGTQDINLHSWTSGAFGVQVACQGTCAASVKLQDTGGPPIVLPDLTTWGCLGFETIIPSSIVRH